LIKAVKSSGADVGIAHDGDADRTICIDEKGKFVFGDKTFAWWRNTCSRRMKVVNSHHHCSSSAIYDIAEDTEER
jgi:phosphomannomutase/phosphoglucomutase